MVLGQSSYKDMDKNVLKVGDRVEIPEDEGTTFTFKSTDLIDQYFVEERIIIANLKGTVTSLLSDNYIRVRLDRQNVRIFMGYNKKDYQKELGPFEVKMDPQWFKKLKNQQPPPNQNSSQPSDEAITKVAQNLIMYQKSREIASTVNKQIALSICPNTAKDGVWTILNMEDKGNYTVIDVKNQWTGKTYGWGSYETFYTKDRIYISKPNFEITKIENYYKSPNVAQVWSTADVLAGFAAIGMGAVILSSGDDSKKSSSSTTSSSGSSSSSSTYSSSRSSNSSGTNSSSSSSGSSGSYNSSNSSQNQSVTKPCYTVKENKTKDILGTTVPYIKVECGKYGNTKEFIYWTKAQGIIHNNGRIGWRVDEQTGYYKYSGGIPITISFLDVDLEKAIKKECSCRDY